MTLLDARLSRPDQGGPSFSLRNRLTRAAWNLCWLLFACWTPWQFNGWRCLLLRMFGARIARGAIVHGSARIWLPAHLEIESGSTIGPDVRLYNQGMVRIGQNCVISQNAYICTGTHDHRDPLFQLVVRPIAIEDNVWIAADAFVGPGVTVRTGTVLAARGVLFKDSNEWSIYSGNPAQLVGQRVMKEP